MGYNLDDQKMYFRGPGNRTFSSINGRQFVDEFGVGTASTGLQAVSVPGKTATLLGEMSWGGTLPYKGELK